MSAKYQAENAIEAMARECAEWERKARDAQEERDALALRLAKAEEAKQDNSALAHWAGWKTRALKAEAERDAAADYASDQAAVIEMVAKSLGVPDEPHQGRYERILEAAEMLVAHMQVARDRLTSITEYWNGAPESAEDAIEHAEHEAHMALAETRSASLTCRDKSFVSAVRKLVVAARTAGGTAGQDQALCSALHKVEEHLVRRQSEGGE